MDCQGQQLDDCKFDHFLMIITHLISDVIILTVRQRLDLQILNNMLSVFSFLPQIPDDFKRKTKPKLIIRIKDFQNKSALKKDPEYLDKLVTKWLKCSDDQYDQVKNVFKQTFDIHPIATFRPNFDKDNEDEVLNIYSESFSELNPSFINACKDVFALCNKFESSDLLQNPSMLKKLIEELKNNEKINFKKLDLYYNIANADIYKNNMYQIYKLKIMGIAIDESSKSISLNYIGTSKETVYEMILNIKTKYSLNSNNVFMYSNIVLLPNMKLKDIFKNINSSSEILISFGS